ncbi:MAG: kelch repeat-containing protein [Planctomycetota bacterium]
MPALIRYAASGVFCLLSLACSSDSRAPTPRLAAFWTSLPTAGPVEETGHAMVFDPVQERVLLCGAPAIQDGGVSVWEWQGQSWLPVTVLGGPSRRSRPGVAFDARRRLLVLFGGLDAATGEPLDDTWEWNGRTWREVASGLRPSGRTGHHMVYDETRGRVVLYGARQPDVKTDVWEWDGVQWIERTPAQSPPPELVPAMAYDSWRRRVVVHGGTGTSGPGQTWEWDGTMWELRAVTGPPGRTGHELFFDVTLGQTVLVGGSDGVDPDLDGYAGTVWEWGGHVWSERAMTSAPVLRDDARVAFDPVGRVAVLFGGRLGDLDQGDTWELLGNEWQRASGAVVPPRRSHHAMCYDEGRGRLVVFGGQLDTGAGPAESSPDTWEWDGRHWVLAATDGPGLRKSGQMVYDSARGQVLMVGNWDTSPSAGGATWVWDGSSWTEQVTATAPPSVAFALADDRARGRVVLYSGDAAAAQAGTWEWDGADWTRVAVSPQPQLSRDHQMAYDEQRGVVVLFGGAVGPDHISATWEWDGVRWTQRSTPTTPAPRAGHRLVYDALRGLVVMFGGDLDRPGGAPAEGTWEWDGLDWHEVARGPLESREGHQMVFDRNRGQVILFGGEGHGQDLWSYMVPASLAQIAR